MAIDQCSSSIEPRPQRRGIFAPGVQAAQASSIAAQFYESQDWWRLRAAIMKALQDFPEARHSVVQALRSLDALKDSDGSPS